MKREELRRYKMSDSQLVQLADKLKKSATRDLEDLADFGVLPATLIAFQSARDAFYNSPTDESLSEDVVIATQIQNAEKSVLMQQIRQISERARIKYGDSDFRFRKYGVDLLSKQRTDEIVRTGRRVQKVATEQLPELCTEGISQAMLDTLGILNNNLDELIDSQLDTIKNRDIAVDLRIMSGNTLYSMMVTIAAKGILCWLDISEKRYNDYVLSENHTIDGHIIDGQIASKGVVNASATGVSSGTVFRFTNTGHSPLNFYFSINPTDVKLANSVEVLPGASQTVTPSNIGYNEDTNATRLIINNSGILGGSYAIEWT
ncbi:MAG: hypothetical protein PSX81_14365 [bacterium]|nr:hypothetical protein [bacterium]